MAKIKKKVLFIFVFLFLFIVAGVGYLVGFANLLHLPEQIYVLRFRDYESASTLVGYWGIESFSVESWKQGLNRGPQAMSLFFSETLKGKVRSDIIRELGTPDGDYTGSEQDLSYLLFRQIEEKDGKKYGARWSLIVVMQDDVFKKMKFYKGCCNN